MDNTIPFPVDRVTPAGPEAAGSGEPVPDNVIDMSEKKIEAELAELKTLVLDMKASVEARLNSIEADVADLKRAVFPDIDVGEPEPPMDVEM